VRGTGGQRATRPPLLLGGPGAQALRLPGQTGRAPEDLEAAVVHLRGEEEPAVLLPHAAGCDPAGARGAGQRHLHLPPEGRGWLLPDPDPGTHLLTQGRVCGCVGVWVGVCQGQKLVHRSYIHSRATCIKIQKCHTIIFHEVHYFVSHRMIISYRR